VLHQICESGYKIVASLVQNAKKLITIDGLDLSLRLKADLTALHAIRNDTYNDALPFLDAIRATRSVITIVRLGGAVNEIFNGTIARNIEERKTFSVIASIAFMGARTLAVAKWSDDIGLFKAEELVQQLHRIGGRSFYAQVAMHPIIAVLQSASAIDPLFAIALSALAVDNITDLRQGKNIAKNFLGIVSLATDITALVLGNKLSLEQIAKFGTIATVTALAESIYNSPNK
jgi:hypothetical protein